MASIWIDLDNAPHVPLFRPLIRALHLNGHKLLITFRDHGYTAELLRIADIPAIRVGRYFGKNKALKVAGLTLRVSQLIQASLGSSVDVAVSHGSRALVLASALLRIPCVTMYDYEFVSTGLFNRLSTKVLLPDAIPDERLSAIGLSSEKVVKYPGFKEEIYLGDFTPDSTLPKELDLHTNRVIAVLRPPATMAHYHNPESDHIFRAILDRLSGADGVTAVILPRTAGQADELNKSLKDREKFRILIHPVNGLNLIWHSDMVIGGGGTMNREAALLGVPVYSTFRGERGALDDLLSRRGLLTFIESVEDVARIPLVKRTAPSGGECSERTRRRSQDLVAFITAQILKLARH